jgi:hypothetical protein
MRKEKLEHINTAGLAFGLIFVASSQYNLPLSHRHNPPPNPRKHSPRQWPDDTNSSENRGSADLHSWHMTLRGWVKGTRAPVERQAWRARAIEYH